MTENNDNRFDRLFTALVSEMTNVKGPDVSAIEKTLIEISLLLRLSMGITRVYQNPKEESEGGGETLRCFDLGGEREFVAQVRVVTSVMSIVTMQVYKFPDTPPLTELERERVDLVMRTVVSFVSRNRLRDIVEKLAYYDDAGYRNIRSLHAYLSKCIGRGKMNGKAIVNYNLRHFAMVNREIGLRLANFVMKNHFTGLEEIIGDSGKLFRLGGDNFIAVCGQDRIPDVTDYLAGTMVHYEENRTPIFISASVGVYVIPDDMVFTDLSDVMDRVIVAQRMAQNGGKEHLIFVDENLLARKERSMRIQSCFPEALRKEEFRVFYQPKVNIETGEMCGAEALCRWFHDGRIIAPGDFIPVLEETNDICELDLYMLRHVCWDIRRWLDECRAPVRVSVNLSRKHVMNAELLRAITRTIDEAGIPHEFIEIELTETTSDVEFHALKHIVSALQKEGIYTSVDDFGVGYSSLNLIRAIPWNVLKVDRSFLPLEEDGYDSPRSIMFRHVVTMARELGLECIAEGVETSRQLRILRENNCGQAQGFLFDRPLPVEEFEERLKTHHYQIP